VQPGPASDFDVSVAIELELAKKVAQRFHRHVRRRRTTGGDELVGLEGLQFHRRGTGRGGGIHHGQGAIERAAMIEAEFRDHEQRLAIADAQSTDFKRHESES
jgi:hypothetical protein